jgi:hypothetical protein
LRHKSRHTVAIPERNDTHVQISNVLGHKLGHGVQAKDKTEIVPNVLAHIANKNLPDITG